MKDEKGVAEGYWTATLHYTCKLLPRIESRKESNSLYEESSVYPHLPLESSKWKDASDNHLSWVWIYYINFRLR